jgi:ankyrin repeat protein
MSDPINVERLRKEAKRILKRCRAGDAASIDRLRAQLPNLDLEQIKLADVHHAVARELGYRNWGELKRNDAPLSRFLAAARSGSLASAQRELGRFPDLIEESIHAACVIGDADALRYHLNLDPGLLNAEVEGWTPIVYACGSPFHRLSERSAAGLVECVTLLLDRGVDPNDGSVLFRAGISGNRALTVLFFQRGVTPTVFRDNSKLVKAGFWGIPLDEGKMDKALADLFSDPAVVEEMRKRMQILSTTYGPWLEKLRGKTLSPRDYYKEVFPGNEAYNTMIWRLLIERGVHPNWQDTSSDTPLHYLAVWGRGERHLAEMGFFLASGADPNTKRADGKTPYFLAVRSGNQMMADVLRTYGADVGEVVPMDELIGACRRVDPAAARNVLDVHPGVLKNTRPEDYEVLAEAASRNRLDQVQLMMDLGFDPGGAGASGATALHAAAWHGHVEMTRMLIGFDAPLNIRDTIYEGTPLLWAAHASKHYGDADDKYCMIIETLLDAGADPTLVNRWGIGPEKLGSQRVGTLLRPKR